MWTARMMSYAWEPGRFPHRGPSHGLGLRASAPLLRLHGGPPLHAHQRHRTGPGPWTWPAAPTKSTGPTVPSPVLAVTGGDTTVFEIDGVTPTLVTHPDGTREAYTYAQDGSRTISFRDASDLETTRVDYDATNAVTQTRVYGTDRSFHHHLRLGPGGDVPPRRHPGAAHPPQR